MRLIVRFTQGGPTDFVARLVAERLTKGLGVQVVIENRGGAGTNIGAELVARANPDGYTVLVGTSALAINRNLYRALAYDAATDLAPVSLMVLLPFFMFVPISSPARSVAEFVAFAKANRGKVKFGSPGTGTPPHLAGAYVVSADVTRSTRQPLGHPATDDQQVIGLSYSGRICNAHPRSLNP